MNRLGVLAFSAIAAGAVWSGNIPLATFALLWAVLIQLQRMEK